MQCNVILSPYYSERRRQREGEKALGRSTSHVASGSVPSRVSKCNTDRGRCEGEGRRWDGERSDLAFWKRNVVSCSSLISA